MDKQLDKASRCLVSYYFVALKKEQGLKVRQEPSAAVEVSLVPFKAAYLDDLLELHRSQKYLNLNVINCRTLPKVGYIAYLNSQPIAAGFLRRVEPCYAQIDTLVSNAYFGSKIRHQGLTLVVNELLEEAKRLKLEGIISITNDEGVLKRAKDLGFHTVDMKVIGMSLTT